MAQHKFIVKRIRIESIPDSFGKSIITEYFSSPDDKNSIQLEYDVGEQNKNPMLTIFNSNKTMQMFSIQGLTRIEMDYYTAQELEIKDSIRGQ